MSRFVEWNDLLLEEFFTPASAGEDVWIHATRNELDAFGLHLGGAQGLIDAVGLGPSWLPSGFGNCADAARLLVKQRRSLLDRGGYHYPSASSRVYAETRAPTYLPILALWVLASSEQTESGFYATVSKLIGQAFPNNASIREAMQMAWDDLQTWASVECQGRFGIFKCRVLGGHAFVGIPRSQCLVSRGDSRGLGRLFWEMRLRPGQHLTDALLKQLLGRGQEAYFLTRALRSAMSEPVYADPLASLIRRLLELWDGRRPRSNIPECGDAPATANVDDCGASEELDEVTLALSPSQEVANAWEVCWRIPATRDSARCMLEIQGTQIAAILESAGGWYVAGEGTAHASACLAALRTSEACAVEVIIQFGSEEEQGVEVERRRASVRRASRRILAWNAADLRFGERLVEREIPLYGPVYVLCSPSDRLTTEPWLQREQIGHEPVDLRGLLDGWWMACIHRSESLSAEQRQQLSDDREPPSVPAARIRFIGGRPLLKGGARLYAAYDLPTVEVEAPQEARLTADGLDVQEINGHLPGDSRSRIRQFSIKLTDGGKSAFDITVLSGPTPLAMQRLRIVSLEGEGRGEARAFSLDRLGRPLTAADGLRGASFAPLCSLTDGSGLESPIALRDLPSAGQCNLGETAAAQFLDSLAALGSMAYGSARDQLLRLSDDIEPIPLLMDLRARGHLEIQTDGKGHVVRIHRVAPTLYALPATQDGLPIFGVCGSLRLRDWSSLIDNGDFIPSLQADSHMSLPVLRLVTTGEETVEAACRSKDLLLSRNPAARIATWAGSIHEAKQAIVSRGFEQFSAELVHLHRLHPGTATFRPVTDGRMSIARETGTQLFRFDDPQAPGLQLYVLGAVDAEGSTRYAHVHDARWGVWISLMAFAEMLRDNHDHRAASPWPIHYDPVTRDLWLPARLRPPVVLERILVLCSGSAPQARLLSNGGHTPEGITLLDGQSKQALGECSPVYGGLLPGLWLRYEWVPIELARRFAELLNGSLMPFGRVSRHAGHEAVAT